MDVEKVREKIKESIKLLCSYPTTSNYRVKENVKKELVEIYKKGNESVKGMILTYINEKLGNAQLFREFESVKNTSFKYKKNIRAGDVTSSILDYTNSLDGTIELINILSKLDDGPALKVLTYHLTRYMNIQGTVFKILALHSIKALAKSNHPYALSFLLNIAEVGGDNKDDIYYALVYALTEWYLKIDKVKMGKWEKSQLKRRMNKVIEIEKRNLKYIR